MDNNSATTDAIDTTLRRRSRWQRPGRFLAAGAFAVASVAGVAACADDDDDDDFTPDNGITDPVPPPDDGMNGMDDNGDLDDGLNGDDMNGDGLDGMDGDLDDPDDPTP